MSNMDAIRARLAANRGETPTQDEDDPTITPAEDDDEGEVTVAGVGEALLSMGTSMGGAIAGAVAGAAEVVREKDPFAFTDAFNHVNAETNKAYMYEPKAAMHALEEFWNEWVIEPTEEHLVQPNVERGNYGVAAFARAAGEGLAMFLPMRPGFVMKPIAAAAKPVAKKIGNTKTAKVTVEKAGELKDAAVEKAGELEIRKTVESLTSKVHQKLRGEKPAAVEALVDVDTGKSVVDIVDAPMSDKGAAFSMLAEFIDRGKMKGSTPHDGWATIGKLLFYKPVQVLRDWNSPALNKLADSIFAPTRGDAPNAVKQARPNDLVNRTASAQGKFMSAFDSMVEPIKGRIGLKSGPSKAIVRGLRTGKIPQKHQAKAAEVRDFLDKFIVDYVRPVLPDVGHIVDYFPQVWDAAQIESKPKAFRQFLKDHLGFDEVSAENFIRRIRENEGVVDMDLTSDRLVDPAQAGEWVNKRIMNEGGASKAASLEKHRKIDITEDLLPHAEKWLVNDLEGVMSSYIRSATQRVEYARLMGANEGALNNLVANAIKELGIEKNPKAVKTLANDVYALADSLQGKYNPIESTMWSKYNRRLANYEVVVHLGLVSLASVPEFAAPAIQFGLVPKAYAKGVASAFNIAARTAERAITGKNRIPKTESIKALESLGQISLNTLQSSHASRFTSVSSKFTSKFMHATGLEALTDVQRVIAYETLGAVIKRNAKAISEGKATRFQKEQMIELGVDPKLAKAWFEEGMLKEGNLADLMENAKSRGTRWAITAPNAATKPRLFSDPHFTNVLLFKSFTGVFSNLFMKRALAELGQAPVGRKASMAGAMVASVTLAYYTQFLREAISGHKFDKEGAQRWLDAIDRSALNGSFTHAYVLASPYRYGFTDSSSKRIFNLLGPAVGDLAKVSDIILNRDMSKEKRAKELAKLVPVANVTAEGREAIADAIEDLL